MTAARWMDTERAAGAEDSGGEARLSHTGTVKVQSLCRGSLLRGTSSSCFCAAVPGINGFMDM